MIRLRPLTEDDFEALFAAASDPLIWEQHPDSMRYTRERFEIYFRSGMDSKGAFAIIDLQTGQIIGSSRFYNYSSKTSSVEIGYTFLARPYWGGGYNRELKYLMMNYAFQFVDTAYFVVGQNNQRSRKAMCKIGGVEVTDVSTAPVISDVSQSVVYRILKSQFE
jgi:RimJ/RimL family protein N-acetyltransferase